MRRGAQEAVQVMMASCNEAAAGNASALSLCKAEAKASAQAALGKTTGLSDSEFVKMQRKAAAEGAEDSMSSCVESAADDGARVQCRSIEAKNALSVSLGKSVTNVSNTELNSFVKEATRGSVADIMVACVAAATSGAEQEACRKGPAGARRSGSAASGPVADALKSTMGKSSVTHVDVESYVRKAGRKRVGEMMGDCVEGATNDNEKMKCRMETAKEAVAVSMGQNPTLSLIPI